MKSIDSDRFGMICDVGGKFKGNQDSALYYEFNLISAPASANSKSFNSKGILALIGDGVSGSNHGEEGSSFIVKRFSSLFLQYIIENDFHLSNIESQINEILLETNTALLTNYKEYIIENKIPKSTIVGFIIIGQWLWVFNLGDSRAYIIFDKKIIQISHDHIGSNTAHEITQAMGQKHLKPHSKVYNWAFIKSSDYENPRFSSHCYAVICSDGLTDKVSDEEINKIISAKKYKCLQEKVEELYKLSLQRQIEDNVSIIIIDLAKYLSTISQIQLIKLTEEGI